MEHFVDTPLIIGHVGLQLFCEHWESMGISGNLWESMGIYGNLDLEQCVSGVIFLGFLAGCCS